MCNTNRVRTWGAPTQSEKLWKRRRRTRWRGEQELEEEENEEDEAGDGARGREGGGGGGGGSFGGSLSKSTHAGHHGNEIGFFFRSFFGPSRRRPFPRDGGEGGSGGGKGGSTEETAAVAAAQAGQTGTDDTEKEGTKKRNGERERVSRRSGSLWRTATGEANNSNWEQPMAVHLIFCRIIAEVVRPLPPSMRCHPPHHRSLATPVLLLFVLPLPRVAVGRVDERGRALCLTFCKNSPRSPPPPPPPSPLRPPHPLSPPPPSPPPPPPSPPHASSTLVFLLFHLLRLHFLTLRCPVSPMVFCCTRSDVRRVDILRYRGEEFPIWWARGHSRSRFSLSLSLPFLSSLSYGRVAVLSRIPRGRAQPATGCLRIMLAALRRWFVEWAHCWIPRRIHDE